jgi:hypothetical protein
MKKTSTDRESSVAAPPFMSGDVMIIVLSIYPEHSESNQAATSVHKTMRACVRLQCRAKDQPGTRCTVCVRLSVAVQGSDQSAMVHGWDMNI